MKLLIFSLFVFFLPLKAKADTLWIKYKELSGTIHPQEPDLVDEKWIISLAISGDYIWCGTQRHNELEWNQGDGVYCFNKATRTCKLYTVYDGLINNKVEKIKIDKNKIVWFGSYGYNGLGGLVRYDWPFDMRSGHHLLNTEKENDICWVAFRRWRKPYATYGSVTDFAIDGSNRVLVSLFGATDPTPKIAGTGNWKLVYSLWRFDGYDWEFLMDTDYFGISGIAPYDSTKFWFSIGVQVEHYDGNTFSPFYGVSGNVNQACFDKNGILWFAEEEHIYCIDSTKSTSWATKDLGLNDEYPNNTFLAVAVDSSNVKWFGTDENGLLRYDWQTWTTYVPDDWTGMHKITALAVDEEGYLWVGTEMGLYKFDNKAVTSVEATKDGAIPFALSAVSPNPFNISTTIKYSLDRPGDVTLSLYSVSGQKVRDLINSKQQAGEHSALWDGRDDNGQTVASGVYLVRLTAGRQTATTKAVFMK